VYIAGFLALRVVLTGAHVEIVEVKTEITNKFLRTILVNSITLVPGSVSLDLQDDAITVLWLQKKTEGSSNIENAGELIKGKLERMLRKMQK
jgi:multisubunit Na+/H+ antiporter MnhE subunit